jgi:hypothetical protein
MENYSFILVAQDGSPILAHQAATDRETAKIQCVMSHSDDGHHILEAHDVTDMPTDQVERVMELASNPNWNGYMGPTIPDTADYESFFDRIPQL